MPELSKDLMVWTPAHTVHNAQLDGEHQQLFSMINRLHAAMLAGRGSAVFGPLLLEARDYVNAHFAHEEQAMRAAGYPALREHIAIHTGIRRQAEEFLARFERGEATMTIEFTLFLSDWLVSHVVDEDRRFGEFVAAGQSAAPTR